MDLLPLYERQVEKTGSWVANATPESLDGPTPCSEWDTRALLNHIIGGNYMFGSAMRDEAMDASQEPPDFAGQDAAGHFQQSAKAALEGFRSPGAMEKMVTLPIGQVPGSVALSIALMDMVVHGWDVAKATGQDPTVDDDIAGAVLAVGEQMLPADGDFRKPPGASFKAPVAVSDDASATDRLVAWFGRQP